MPDGVTVLSARQAIAALEHEWQALWEAANTTAFQSPAWLLPWWDAFESGELWVITVREGGRLAAVAPLYVDRGTVRLIGSGNTDYLDLIAAPGREREAAEAVLLSLAGLRKRWTECDLLDVPAASGFLKAAAPAALRIARSEADACPVITLPGDAAALEPMLASRLRKGFRQYKKRFGDRGAFRFELAGEREMSEYIEAFFGLHAARWRAAGESGVLDDERVRAFHRCAAERMFHSGLLRFYGLRDEAGALRAVLYTLVRGKRMYSYLAGHDPALEGFSPGTVMLRLVLEDAIGAGFREFDFLRGREPYKYDWGARDEITWRMRVFPA